MRSRAIVVLAATAAGLLSPLSSAAPSGAAAPVGDALSRDLDGDGVIDGVRVRTVTRPADWRACRVAVGRRAAVARITASAGHTLLLRFREGSVPDTASRPSARCRVHGRGVRLRAADGAPPVLVGSRAIGGGFELRFSERVRLSRSPHRRTLAVVANGVRMRVRIRGRAGTVLAVTAAAGASIDVAGALRAIASSVSDSAGLAVRARRAAQSGALSPPASRGVPAVATSGVAPPPDALPDVAAVKPRTAAALRASVGVNVHTAYYDTAYNDFTAVRQRLADLGVRNVRDGACAGCIDQRARLATLGRDGMRLTLIMGRPRSGESLGSLIGAVEDDLAPYVAALEGPNEYDISGDPDWAAGLRDYQAQLWSRVHASPALAGVEVLGPSLVNAASFGALGDISASFDCGTIHPYAGGREPAATLAYNLSLARIVSGPKPVCATESGYHNALAASGGHPAASEQAAGAYVPRMYLDFFAAGLPRTFLYELVDERPDPSHSDPESNFGLLRSDFSPKPAYQSLRALLALTAPTGTVDPRPLRVAIAGSPDLRSMVLQTGANEYAVVVWRDARVWDPDRGVAVPVASAAATLTFGQRAAVTEVGVADPGASTASATPLRRGQMTVDVGAYPVVAHVRTG